MSDSGKGSGSRPKPQYGEYATPEEQRAAIREPADYYDWLSSNRPVEAPTAEPIAGGAAPTDPSTTAPDASQPPVPPVAGDPARGPYPGAGPLARPARPRGADRFATFALLALGLFDTVSAVVGTSAYSAAIVGAMQSAGFTGANADMLPSWLGPAVALIDVVLWLAALLLSLRFMRRGRLSFWIPLAAGVAAAVIGGLLAAVLLATNPDFAQLMSGITPPASGSGS